MSKIKVILFMDPKSAVTIQKELKSHFPSLPWSFRSAGDQLLALELYRQETPQIVILDENLPETSPVKIAQDMNRYSAGASFFVLSSKAELIHPTLESLDWPPVSWIHFGESLIQGLPLNEIERLSGWRLKSLADDALFLHAEKYRKEDGKDARWLKMAWIPVSSSDFLVEQSQKGSAAIMAKVDSGSGFPSVTLSIWNFLISGLVFAAGFGLWIYQPEEDYLLLAGLKWASSIMSIALILGLFVQLVLVKAQKKSISKK